MTISRNPAGPTGGSGANRDRQPENGSGRSAESRSKAASSKRAAALGPRSPSRPGRSVHPRGRVRPAPTGLPAPTGRSAPTGRPTVRSLARRAAGGCPRPSDGPGASRGRRQPRSEAARAAHRPTRGGGHRRAGCSRSGWCASLSGSCSTPTSSTGRPWRARSASAARSRSSILRPIAAFSNALRISGPVNAADTALGRCARAPPEVRCAARGDGSDPSAAATAAAAAAAGLRRPLRRSATSAGEPHYIAPADQASPPRAPADSVPDGSPPADAAVHR